MFFVNFIYFGAKGFVGEFVKRKQSFKLLRIIKFGNIFEWFIYFFLKLFLR